MYIPLYTHPAHISYEAYHYNPAILVIYYFLCASQRLTLVSVCLTGWRGVADSFDRETLWQHNAPSSVGATPIYNFTLSRTRSDNVVLK
jgi:hypothetical protein